MRVACYIRCSTADQHVETQVLALRSYCAARGWTAVREFIDRAESGAKTRRPALDQMLADVRARRLDVIVVCAFDRLGRSTRHLVECLDLFRHLGITFISLREQIDTATYIGEALFTIIAALAQLERSFIRERVVQGIARARAEGKRLGREPLAVDPARLHEVRDRRLSVRAAARVLGVSKSTAWRLVRTHAAAATTESAERA